MAPTEKCRPLRSLGMSETVFSVLERDDTAHLCASLTHQYRMNGAIMRLANALTYDGQLVCAHPHLAHATLLLPGYQESLLEKLPDWLGRAVMPSQAVLLLDTAGGAAEQECPLGINNPDEVIITARIVATLLQLGVAGDDIGVIAPYRAQVRLLQETLTREVGHHLTLCDSEDHLSSQGSGNAPGVVTCWANNNNDNNPSLVMGCKSVVQSPSDDNDKGFGVSMNEISAKLEKDGVSSEDAMKYGRDYTDTETHRVKKRLNFVSKPKVQPKLNAKFAGEHSPLLTKVTKESKRVEINTVDQYQGRDKEVIVYSCVRSCTEPRKAGDLLKDSRRLNVAMTRAKRKLIMVGSVETLKLYEPFQKLLSVLNDDEIFQFTGQDWRD
ncbi:P-loop containing nucleoside triphosphate hydrolase [Trinorchestia longiramus]|nr:P-loop containing nucleoside triphosphate hydrolase [Trinorchestia longiramus]